MNQKEIDTLVDMISVPPPLKRQKPSSQTQEMEYTRTALELLNRLPFP